MRLKKIAGAIIFKKRSLFLLFDWKKAVAIMLISLVCFSAEAVPLLQTDLSAGCGQMSGNTEYRVGGKISTANETYKVHFPVSRLSFPVESYLFFLRAGITYKDRLTGSVSWHQNLTDDPGKMKDYDWEMSPADLTIYSKSRLNMGARMLSGEIRYRLYRIDLAGYAPFFHPGDNWQLLAGGEYLYRHFDFRVYDTLQTYPGQNISPDFVPGRTLEYDVDYLIPLLKLGTALELAKGASVELAIGYSPYARAKDEDRHLLRNMVSTADCDGDAWMFSGRLRYLFADKWFAGLLLSYLEIETEGTSKTYINNRLEHIIDTEIISRQSLVTLTIGRNF